MEQPADSIPRPVGEEGLIPLAEKQRLRIAVLGTGYLGATHAACMAELGFDVLGMDIDADKVASADRRRVPFYEPGLDRAAPPQTWTPAGCASPPSYAEAAAFGDVHFICVGTPQSSGEYAADLTLRRRRRRRAGPAPATGRAWSSASPRCRSGTAARLAARLAELAPAGDERRAGLEPRVPARGLRRRGHARTRTGSSSASAPHRGPRRCCARSTPAAIADGTPFVVTDFATAELVKVAANAFLATKISFINAMAEVCEAAGADVVAAGRGARPTTTGSAASSSAPGLGFGGGCLPKDIRAFMARAGELGVGPGADVPARGRRDQHAPPRPHGRPGPRARAADRSSARTVAVLGAAFKPNTDDIRDSPALDVAAHDAAAGRPGHGLRPGGDGQRPQAPTRR